MSACPYPTSDAWTLRGAGWAGRAWKTVALAAAIPSPYEMSGCGLDRPAGLRRAACALGIALALVLPGALAARPGSVDCIDSARLDSESVYSYLRYYEDVSRDRIQSPADLREVELKPLAYESVSFGFSDSIYWFVLCVRGAGENGATNFNDSGGAADRDLVLGLHNTFLEHVDVYSSGGGDSPRFATRLGLQSGVAQTWPIYHFHVESGTEHELYLRVDSRSPLRFSASLDPLLDFYRDQSFLNYVIGGIICSILALAVYNLILYFQLGDKNYLLYFAFLIFLTGYRLLFHGLPVPFFSEFLRTHYLALTLVFAELTSFFIIRWMLVFLNVSAYSRRLYFLGNLLALSCVPTIAFALFDPFTVNRIVAIKALVVIVLSVPVPIFVWRRGYRPALWFIIAFAMAPVNISALILASFGLLPFDLFTRLSVDITSLAQALLLSLALADRIRLSDLAHREELSSRVEERTRELRTEVELRGLAQERAETATRAREDFLANMSHEIRTPMNAILGMADLLEETPLDATQKEYIHTFQRAGRNLQRLLNDVLDISKVDSGALPIQNEDFDLHALLDDLERIHGSVPRSEGVALIFEQDASTPRWIRGDAGRLSQILMNLLSNALKFTRSGSVRLQARVRPGGIASAPAAAAAFAPESGGEARNPSMAGAEETLCITVSDTGVGMSPKEMERVFERFFQSDMTYARRAGGGGLGLAISHRLAELMGGRLSAQSEAGRGSEFHLLLPCVRVRAREPEAKAGNESASGDANVSETASGSAVAAPAAGGPGEFAGTETAIQANAADEPRGALILGVDDSEDNRELLRHYFKKGPHRIDLADGGPAALRMFGLRRYDLVLMDIQMPGMDGFDTTRALRDLIRAMPADSSRPAGIVALTAYATEREVAAIRDFGFDAYLQKPISRKDLLAAVDALLAAD
ncbi:MAG: 7TM diverse intracellular signaling domain-containing protein [Leptospirales bacterium]